MTPSRERWADDVRTGAAAGLLPGALVLDAPLLGAVVGMPGAAVRYVLLTAALLYGLGAGVTRGLRRRRPVTPRTAARCALLACLLVAVAGLWPSVPVYCGTVLAGALVGAPGLCLFRATPAWCVGGLAGLGAAGGLTGWAAEHAGMTLTVCGVAGAVLLTPLAVRHAGLRLDNAPSGLGSSPATTDSPAARTTAPYRAAVGTIGDGPSAPGAGVGRSAPGPGVVPFAQDAGDGPSAPGTSAEPPTRVAGARSPMSGADNEPPAQGARATARVPAARSERGAEGTRTGSAARSATVDVVVLSAAAAAAFFAAQDLLVFRRLELGGAPATLTGTAALAAAIVPAALLRRTGGGARGPVADDAVGGPAFLPRDPSLPLLLLAVAAATAALAAAADTRQLVAALALALGSAAAGVSTLRASFRGTALPALLGALAGIGALALTGRLLDAGDALVLASALPLSRAALLLRADRAARRVAVPGAAPPALEVRRLTMRHKNRPRVTRLRLSVAPGELVVLHDGLPGRRAGSALRAIAGIPRPSFGRRTILGHDVTRTDAATRWRLGLCALLDPQDGAVPGALPQLASPTSVSGALRTTVAPLEAERADELCRAARAAFPFLAARGDDPPAALEPVERCVLGLALTLIARPRLLLLDLTGPGTRHLAADPDVADLLRRITGQGTAVLVAVREPSPVLGGRAVGFPTGRRAPRPPLVPRTRKASA
jgi:ABC-type branched-subunit amino acid transport system ATPase component